MLFVAFVGSLTALVEDAITPLLSYLFWILIGSFVCGLFFRPKLKIEFCPQGFGTPESPIVLAFEVINTGGLPAYDFQLHLSGQSDGFVVAQPTADFSSLKAGESRRVEFAAMAKRRGAWDVPDLMVTSYFPIGMFGFMSRHRHHAQQVIAPRTDRAAARLLLDETIFGGRQTLAAQDEQPAGVNQRSDEYEYIGSREFQPGLDARRWDYKATARLGAPIVREYAHYAQTSAFMIVDDRLADRSAVSSQIFESVLEVAATCVETFDEQAKQLTIALGGNAAEFHTYDAQMLALAQATGNSHPTDYRKLIQELSANESTHWGSEAYGARKQVLVVTSEGDAEAREALDELSNHAELEICFVFVPRSWQRELDSASEESSNPKATENDRIHASRGLGELQA